MAESSKAVFLSYASQDAEAARRICDVLRAGGIEVWFDQSELRGGDAWDQEIRRQIRDCALFIPIISSNTQARLEGYFRREWKLAAARTRRTSAPAASEPAYQPVPLEEVEKRHILRTLAHTDWNKSQAAGILNIERSTLDRKIKVYGLKR